MYKPAFEAVFTDGRIIPQSGLSVVGAALAGSDFLKNCNRIPIDKKRSEPQINDVRAKRLAVALLGGQAVAEGRRSLRALLTEILTAPRA